MSQAPFSLYSRALSSSENVPCSIGVAAGLQEGVDAVDAVGVGGHLPAHRMRGLDDGFQLLVGELLGEARSGLGEHAAGRGDLDDVGAVAHALAHRAAAIIGAASRRRVRAARGRVRAACRWRRHGRHER